MKRILVQAELSYLVGGVLFQVHNDLGRFCREKQYADRFEQLLQEQTISYLREAEISKIKPSLVKGNRPDFIIDQSIVVDLKAKPIITKDDYYQMQRYLRDLGIELGLIVNFRAKILRPKRILNTLLYSEHSDNDSDH